MRGGTGSPEGKKEWRFRALARGKVDFWPPWLTPGFRRMFHTEYVCTLFMGSRVRPRARQRGERAACACKPGRWGQLPGGTVPVRRVPWGWGLGAWGRNLKKRSARAATTDDPSSYPLTTHTRRRVSRPRGPREDRGVSAHSHSRRGLSRDRNKLYNIYSPL